jgi:hypothetical protein
LIVSPTLLWAKAPAAKSRIVPDRMTFFMIVLL